MILQKPTRSSRIIAQHERRRATRAGEKHAKLEVRRRDKHCRVPGCGCRLRGLPLEVAHLHHKGAGGDPTLVRTMPEQMVLVCRQRHQDGVVSLHRGTLRCEPLTEQGCNGPVRWLVDLAALYPDRFLMPRWTLLAEEKDCGLLLRPTVVEYEWIKDLAMMNR